MSTPTAHPVDPESGETRISNLGTLKYASHAGPGQIPAGMLGRDAAYSSQEAAHSAKDACETARTGCVSPATGDVEPRSDMVALRVLAEIGRRIARDARIRAEEGASQVANAAKQAHPGLGSSALYELESAVRSDIEAAYISAAVDKLATQMMVFVSAPTATSTTAA